MPKATALSNTFLKSKLLGSEDLKDSEMIFIPKDNVFYVSACAPARNQHYALKLASPLPAKDGKTKLQNVFGYVPHIDVEGTATVIKLPVKYCSQLDNDPSIFGPGWRQCNTTSNTMLADFLLKGELTRQAKAQGYPEPESVYMRLVQKYGDTTDHGAQTKALRDLGIESYFSYSLSKRLSFHGNSASYSVINQGKTLGVKLSGGISLTVGDGNRAIITRFGSDALVKAEDLEAFITAARNALGNPAAEVSLRLDDLQFSSGHDLETFLQKLSINPEPGEVQQ